MKLNLSTIMWTFIWCLFMGVTAISIGFGALFPSMNLISKPFVCPGGNMDVVEQVYNPYPGKTITTLTWYCVDGKTGIKTELGIFPMSLYAGLIYGLALFVLVLIGMVIVANRRPASNDSNTAMAGFKERYTSQANAANISSHEPVEEKLKKLKELLDSDLITKQDYEKKKAEILSRM